jgi:hypothetical protein
MRRTLPFASSLFLAAAACGPAEVVVTMELDVPNPEGSGTIVQSLSDVEVQLIPFDRDAVFDSLATAYGTPEPAIPQELIEARNEVQAANEEWQENVRRWQTIRDTLQALNDLMEPLARGESRYVLLFREWQDWESQLGGAERAMDQSFARFTELQEGTIRASDSVRIAQDNWADDAFAEVTPVFDAKFEASGLDWAIDTTDASGVARGPSFRVKPGAYWVHARYELAYTELYWNFPIQAARGEPTTVVLNRENAEERIKL